MDERADGARAEQSGKRHGYRRHERIAGGPEREGAGESSGVIQILRRALYQKAGA
jgi:hypothetical protein